MDGRGKKRRVSGKAARKTAKKRPAQTAIRKAAKRKSTARPAIAKKTTRAQPDAARRARARKILRELHRLYPDAECALDHQSALQLLVATILSAQSTDANVNKVTPALFRAYPDARALAAASREEIERAIHSTGFFRQKTKSIQGACARIVEAFGGEVPGSMEELLTLPGVARKTANVILGTWFAKNEGVVVDTHIGRLACLLELTWTSRGPKDAVRIEQDLMQLFPREEWTFLGHALIWHGRRVCVARRPRCVDCTLAKHCPSAFALD